MAKKAALEHEAPILKAKRDKGEEDNSKIRVGYRLEKIKLKRKQFENENRRCKRRFTRLTEARIREVSNSEIELAIVRERKRAKMLKEAR